MARLHKPEFCTINGHKIAYHRFGRGETVLLVHGITTWSFIWRNMIDLLSEQYDVISIDLLGCGDSDKPLDIAYSLKNHARFIKQFMDELKIEKFHFVGHDLGGGIAQIFAVQHESCLYDLSLLNPVGFDYWPVQPISTMRTPIVRQLAIASLDFGAFKLIIRRALHNPKRLTPELMQYFWKPLRTREGRKAFLHFARSLDNRELVNIGDRLRALQIPVLIVRGLSDRYLNAQISEKLNRYIPGSRLVELPNAGHFLQEDDPQGTCRILMSFYNERN